MVPKIENEYIAKYMYPFEDNENIGWKTGKYQIVDYNSQTQNIDFDSTNTVEFLQLNLSMLDIHKNGFEFKFPETLIGLNIKINCDFYKVVNEQFVTEVVGNIIQIQKDICKCIFENIPKNIKYLETIDIDIGKLGVFHNLKTLIIDGIDPDFNNNYEFLDNLPNSLERLEIIISEFNHTLDNLPSNLKVLVIDTGSTGDYCNGYPQELNYLPAGLEVLYFPETISVSGDDYPANLNNLPSQLKYLRLYGATLSKNIEFNNLPDSLKVIEFHNYFANVGKIQRYPTNLKMIISNCPIGNYSISMTDMLNGITIAKQNLQLQYGNESYQKIQLVYFEYKTGNTDIERKTKHIEYI